MMGDDFDAYTASLRERLDAEGQANLRGALNFGVTKNPAKFAQDLNVAKSTGTSVDQVENPELRPELEKAAKIMGLSPDELMQRSPKTAKFVSDPVAAGVAHTALPQLEDMERSYSEASTAEAKRVEEQNSRAGIGLGLGTWRWLQSGAMGLGAVPYDLVNSLSAMTIGRFAGPKAHKTVMDTLTEDQFGGTGLGLSRLASEAQQDLSGAYGRQTPNIVLTNPTTGEQFINWKGITGESVIQAVAQEAVPMLAQTAVTILTGGAGAPILAKNVGRAKAMVQNFWRLATSPAAAIEISRTISGQYENAIPDLMQKHNVPREEAEVMAAPGAWLAGVFSFVGGAPMEAKFMEHLTDVVARAPGGNAYMTGVLGRLKIGLTSRAKNIGLGVGKEGLQEVLNGIGEDTAAWLTYNPDKTFTDAVGNAIQNFVGGAAMGGAISAGFHGNTALSASRDRAFILALHDKLAATEFAKVAPEHVSQYVSQLTKDGHLENLYIKPEEWSAYWQGQGLTEEAAKAKAIDMGTVDGVQTITSEDYDMSRQNGGQIALPTGRVASDIAGTEHFKPLFDKMAPQQGSSSFGETANVEESARLAQEAAEVPETKERMEIRSQVADQIQSVWTGLSRENAEAMADQHSRILTVLAGHAKISPMQMYEQKKVEIREGFQARLEQQQQVASGQGGTTLNTGVGNEFQTSYTGTNQRPHRGDAPGAKGSGRTDQEIQARAARQSSLDAAESDSYNGHINPETVLRGENVVRAEETTARLGLPAEVTVSSGNQILVKVKQEGLTAYVSGVVRDGNVYVGGMNGGGKTGINGVGTDLLHLLAKAAVKLFPEIAKDGELRGVIENNDVRGRWSSTVKEVDNPGGKAATLIREILDNPTAAPSETLYQNLPTRVPTSKGAVQDPNTILVSGLEAMMLSPATFEKNMAAVSAYPGIKMPKGLSPADQAEFFINHVKDNLLWLHDQMPQAIRDRAKLWYDGAHRIAQNWADDNSKTLSQVAGIFAVLSPQRDWFQNVSLGARVLSILSKQRDTAWSKEMEWKFKSIDALSKLTVLHKMIKGKTLGQITDPKAQALWVRLYDEAHGQKQFHVISPEAKFVGTSKTLAGEDTNIAWGSLGQIEKAINIYNDSSPQVISDALGAAHKVRNFYNNIFDPSRPEFATIDTHAVGAGNLLPMGGDYPIVAHNFGSSPIKSHHAFIPWDPVSSSSSVTGTSGTYGLYQEAYIRAAAERGILPREMQSITWEGIKGLFTPEFRTPENYNKVVKLWERYTDGKASLKATRNAISKLAGGMKPPEWAAHAPDNMSAFHGQILAESMPGGDVRSGIFPNIHNATEEQLKAYHAEKMGLVLKALKAAGIDAVMGETGHGYWGGNTNPVTAFSIKLNVDPESESGREQLNHAAEIVADTMQDQDAVGWVYPSHTDDVTQHNAVRVKLDRALSAQELVALGQALESSGLPVFPDASNPSDIKIISYNHDPQTAAQYHAQVLSILDAMLPVDVKSRPAESYRAINGMANKGAYDTEQKSKPYTDRRPERERSLRYRATNRGHQEIEALNQRYRTQYGWGSDERSTVDQRGVPVYLGYAERQGLEPSTAHIVHYSNTAGLQYLTGEAYGTGSPGKERPTLEAFPKGHPLRLVTFGYVSTDGGLPPREHMIPGTNPVEFIGTNLIDLRPNSRTEHANELLAQVRKNGDMEGLGGVVTKAGYNGYIAAVDGIPGEVVVMIGHDKIPVRAFQAAPTDVEGPTGGITKITTAPTETLHQDGEGLVPAGKVTFGPAKPDGSNTYEMTFLQARNLSTPFHEFAHIYLEIIGDLVTQEQTSQELKDDYGKILSWFGVTDRSQITTQMKEQFADGYLVHLSEGVAPVPELAGAYARFAAWMAKVGKQLLGTDVPMTDEIRGVFQRMVASSESIEQANNDLGPALFATAEDAKMSKAEFAALSNKRKQYLAEAKERMVQKLTAEKAKEQNKEWTENRQKIEDEVRADVESRPEYVALKALVDGQTAAGTPVKLAKAILHPEEITMLDQSTPDGNRPYTNIDAKGMDLDSAATILGYESGDHLLKALSYLPASEALIAQMTDEKMKQAHGDPMSPEALRAMAVKELSTEKRGEIIATELRILNNLKRESAPAVRVALAEQKAVFTAEQQAQQDAQKAAAVEQRAGQKEATGMPKIASFRLAASTYISRMLLSNIDPASYMRLQQQFGREAYSAALKKDYTAAYEAKRKELLNHFLYIEAMQAKELGENFRAWVKKNDSKTVRGNIGKAGGEYLAQYDALRDSFGIERVSNAQIEEQRTALALWVERMAANYEDSIIPEWILDETNRKNYKELTVAETRDLFDSMKNIKHLAYRETHALIEGQRVDRKQMITEITEAGYANIQGMKESLRSTDPSADKVTKNIMAKLMNADSSMLKIELLVNWVDGKNIHGPMHKYIWNRLVKAQNDYYDKQLVRFKALSEAFAQMPKEQRNSMDKTFQVQGFKTPVSKKEIITMLLYSGQESRLAKLIGGYPGMKDAGLLDAFTHLTKEDAAWVNSVWAEWGKLKPEILDLEQRSTGVRPEWEASREFNLYDAKGNITARMTGGYFPLIMDPNAPGEIHKKQEGGTVGQLFDNNYARASTSKGHTKELTGATYPLLLDFEHALTANLSNQLKDLAYREAVLDINRILKNSEFQKMIKEKVGDAYEAQLMPWLVNIVNDGNSGASLGLSFWNKLAMSARGNAVAAILGFKYTTGIVQIMDAERVVRPGNYRVTYPNFAAGVLKFLAHPIQTTKLVRELSSEMRHRPENIDRDMREQFRRLLGDTSIKAAWNRAAFKHLGFMDSLVSIPAWLGAFNQAIKAGETEEDAVLMADRTVRTRLMSSNPKDQVAVQHGDPMMKLLTMFMGDASNNYNMMRDAGHEIDGIKGVPTFTSAAVLLMAAGMIAQLVKGQGPDDDEDPAAWALRKALLQPFQTVPVVRDGAAVVDNMIGGKPFTDWQFSPVLSIATKATGALKSTMKLTQGEEEWGDWAIKSGEAFGYALGYGGTAQAAASTKYLKRYMEGEESPDNPIQFGYDLLRGKPKGKP